MKNFLFVLFFLFLNIESSFAQHNVGISYHHSSYSKIGGFVEVFDKGIIELRILDNFLIEDFSAEISGFYKFVNKRDHEVYGGVGYAFSAFEELIGVIITGGVNFYPFGNKRFGFQVELNPLIREGGSPVIRASGGFRYKFFKDEKYSKDDD